jgi:hypothetical protein
VRGALVLALASLSACGGTLGTAPESDPASAPPSASASVSDTVSGSDTVSAPAREPPTERELAWDDHVGWEPRLRFPPGQISVRRPEGSYLRLETVLALAPPFVTTLLGRSGGVALRDKPLVARPEDLCHPALRAAVTELAPDRLLLDLEGDLDAASLACLEALPVPTLFLSTCRHDGALPTMDHCLDGDAQLARLAASPALRDRMVGLAIGLGDEPSWALLASFPRLEHLAVRGEALDRVDPRAADTVCGRLRQLDLLDPLHGQSLHQHPHPFPFSFRCLARLEVFHGRRLPPVEPVPVCALRHVALFSLDAERRAALVEACGDEVEIETPEDFR